MKVLIVHIPYKYRGGEDAHVDALIQAYQNIGATTVVFPENQLPPENLLSKSFRSLAPDSDSPEIERIWRGQGFDYIHLHNAFPILGPRFFRWALKNQIPMVMTVHNHRFFCTNGLALRDGKICKDCFNSKVAWRAVVHNCNGSLSKSIYHSLALTEMRLEDLYARSIQRFIVPSPYLQAELVRLGLPKERVTHILNPVFWENTSVRPDSSDHRAEKYDALYAGRLSQEKGIRSLLAAAKSLPDVRFLIAGDGPMRPEVERAVLETQNLTFLGSVRHDEVRDLICQSRIAALPSICNETLSTFALEVFYQGKRCVVPALESTSWLASGDFLGHLAKAGDPVDLARAIREALRSPQVDHSRKMSLQNKLGFDRFCKDLRSLVRSMETGTQHSHAPL